MTRRAIEDFGLIGDLQTGALVGRDATIEWLCLPSFASDACFASLLGDERHGGWSIRPSEPIVALERRYCDASLVLETTLRTQTGCVRVTDFMQRRGNVPALVRIIDGDSGTVSLMSHVACRFGYGKIAPWTKTFDRSTTMVAGADGVVLHGSHRFAGAGPDATATVRLGAGERAWFSLQWYPSHESPPEAFDAFEALASTLGAWTSWSAGCRYSGRYRDAVLRSLITLKALTDEPTGGTVAAVTTSLPEQFGGAKNWDYRFSWLRDSAFTISALLGGGFEGEARAWRDWLLRMIAGSPGDLQIMYSTRGDRRLDESTADWLPGYEGCRPVRIGNAAFEQFQLGVYGGTMDAIIRAHEAGISLGPSDWAMLCTMLDVVELRRNEPDQGIWESRGAPQHYTLSRVMVWVAFDRAIRAVDEFGYDGPVERWRRLAADMHEQICSRAYRPELETFVQCYESDDLDASLLLMPLLGFLPATDPRMLGTVKALERNLFGEGFLFRTTADPEGTSRQFAEGAFLACNFWLVECYALAGRYADADALFERLLGVRNDLGLLSEEYDVHARRQAGNVPQTLSHAALIGAALRLEGTPRPS